MRLKNIIDRLIDWGNDIPATPWQMGALFAVTVIMRNLMEALQLGIVFTAPAFFLHFPVAYVFPMLTLVFLMSRFSGYDTGKLLKIMVFAWTLTLLPPLIDWITGNTSDIGYFPLTRSNAGWFFLNFFNPTVALTGTTTGIRVEAALGCLLAGIFTWTVTSRHRILKGLLNTLVFAPVFLSFFTWPYLIAILFQPFFPGDGTTLTLLQWHAATEAPLTGDSHFVVYIIDMVPVTFLAAWFMKELSPKRWSALKGSLRGLIPQALAAAAGTAAAFAIADPAGLTFCDTVALVGALLASVWVLGGSSLSGGARAVATAVGLSLAWSAGWLTLVFALLAAGVSSLPLPGGPRRVLTSAVLFITAISPVGFSLAAPSAAAALVLIPVITLLSARKPLLNLFFAVPMAILLASPPASGTGAYLRGINRRVDTFARSSRIGLAMESASRQTAGGGTWLRLAETTHLGGLNARSRYICETAMARGDSTGSLMKVAINLAFARGDSSTFNDLYMGYVNAVEDPADLNEAMMMRVTFQALSGDTASLNSLHSRVGMNPVLMRSMATGLLASGDTLGALQYSMAYLSCPDADAGDWARTITLAAVTGGENWDSLYTRAEEKLGICLPVMLARLRAPVVADSTPDRRDLLERCLLTRPDDPDVLFTASMWHMAAGSPDSALIYSSRSLAGSRHPSRRLFEMVISAALDAGRFNEARIAAEYAVAEYPEGIRFQAYLSGILLGMDPATPVPDFQGHPDAMALRDSVMTMVCEPGL